VGLRFEGVAKRFGGVTAVEDVTLEAPKGAFVCLLGPSGCGKTTLLRMAAGLESPSAGRILIDGADVTDTPAHRRDIGMVFQSLALFPHLSVAENVAYPLRLRGVAARARREKAEALLELVRLPGLGDRAVDQLSGGQRQRVAIARALSLEPRLFLLDEPLSALDAKLREAMQVELRQLQQRLGVTTVVVTHDQREAMTMADIVVVMGEGRIRQAAPPAEVYRRPADAFVADFIGATNLLPATRGPDGDAVALGAALPGAPAPAASFLISVRPEDLGLGPAGGATLTGRVTFVRDLGAGVETFVEAGGAQLVAASPRPVAAVGQTVGLTIDPARAVALPG
jgi:putative spermidine/putrescine transport system ATP-binding protein